MNVSVLILTYNEEVNLPACLQSVAWSDDIVVFDSFSTDRTVQIARQFGARVYQRKFDTERNQRKDVSRSRLQTSLGLQPRCGRDHPAALAG
jgi:glycosyltransferase involved in cell wall biosynthesis